VAIGTASCFRTPTIVDLQVAADDPAQPLHRLREGRDSGGCQRIVGGEVREHSDAAHALALLRPRCERPPRRRPAEKRAPGIRAVYRKTQGESLQQGLIVLNRREAPALFHFTIIPSA
jgi:hypothetical protein